MTARYGPAPPERSTCTRRVSWFRLVARLVVVSVMGILSPLAKVKILLSSSTVEVDVAAGK